MELTGYLIAIAGLLLVRALVAALEAACVAVGLPRAEALVESGNLRAKALRDLIADPEATMAAMRLTDGTTLVVAAFLATQLAPDAIGSLPAHWTTPLLLVVTVFASVAFSAAGRAAGGARGEAIGLRLSIPALALRTPLAPFGFLLARLVAPFVPGKGRFSLPRPPLEEMERWLAENAKQTGSAAGQTTSELIHRVFEFRDKVARDVMVARTEVVAIEIDTPAADIIRLIAEEGHSRLPVYRVDLDHILGTLHARDLVPLLAHPELIVLRDLIRPAHFVPWSKPVDQLLREMQRRKVYLMVVVDEYGGVMGICTLEDVLEQIVGDIGDEFHVDDDHKIEIHADGSWVVPGGTSVAHFNETVKANLPEDQGYETIAGFLNAQAGAIPNIGEKLVYHGWIFTVTERDPKRVTRVRASRMKKLEAAAAPN